MKADASHHERVRDLLVLAAALVPSLSCGGTCLTCMWEAFYGEERR